MTQIRGFCYRVCNECEIFKATVTDNDQKRLEMEVLNPPPRLAIPRILINVLSPAILNIQYL
jgi:hypothetical protein